MLHKYANERDLLMARYAPERKDATRRRMIETAGVRFKRDGFDGAGISALVADAGLTNGAFYGHFASKDELIATVVSEQLAVQVARVEALPPGLASVETFVREYLSPEHRDDPGNGCPSAALLDEITRQDHSARQAYTDGARALIDAIARHLTVGDDVDARDRAIGLFTLLVSSLQLARAVTDPELSDQILSSAYQNATRIVDITTPKSIKRTQETK
ncbi:TetR/AcrR family transcriptional regulator [Gordonia defluvii]|jgi:AcrR family transcriptional regulator|uniref:TetR/AcrR family transcriptional regulator n=1 Tax=Gordonia defluvii TaxID=283718 RepID=A0ABP6LAR7_9ACTN|nr:TetR/AcrR family transcriptional regulator [Gordonia sp. UBA5067]